MKNYLRGEIYYANLEPVIGSEQGGYRPVLILQDNHWSKNSNTIIVAPLTKYINRDYFIPCHVNIHANKKLKYDSIIMLEQIRTISKTRLSKFIMKISISKQKKVDKAILIILDLKEEFK